jgi:hypothetical protein
VASGVREGAERGVRHEWRIRVYVNLNQDHQDRGSRTALLYESATERQVDTSLKRPKAHHAQLAKDLAPVLGYLTPRKVFTKLLNGMGASPA